MLGLRAMVLVLRVSATSLKPQRKAAPAFPPNKAFLGIMWSWPKSFMKRFAEQNPQRLRPFTWVYKQGLGFRVLAGNGITKGSKDPNNRV